MQKRIDSTYLFMTLAALLASFFLFLPGCSDDEDDGGTEPSYDFIDQKLQGRIEGEDFTFGDGEVSFDADEMSLDLYSTMESSSACELFIGEYSRVFLTMAAEVGISELSFDLISGTLLQNLLFVSTLGTETDWLCQIANTRTNLS